MMKLVLGVACLFMVGCASTIHRGVVAMKLSGNEAHVGIGSKEVTVGDHVELYRNQCQGGGERSASRCKKISLGHGEVTEILNEDYTVVRFSEGTQFSEGDMIEKHRH